MSNQVTELDLRMPEFRDPKLKLEDLEFDADGQVVRKDRFERAVRQISGILHGVNGLSASTGWTCDQVIEAVRQLRDQGVPNIINGTIQNKRNVFDWHKGDWVDVKGGTHDS